METRELTLNEQGIVELLLTRDFPGRDALLVQAETVRTTGLSCTCGCPSFSLEADRALPPAAVVDRRPSDAHGTDPGGHQIGVLLFVDDGYLADVEIFSYEEESVFAGLPDPGALKLSEWSTPDDAGVSRLRNP
jgi:hypothetical protein